MPFAARIGDLHACPMVTPGLPPIPHVGGPIIPPCCVNVLIGGQPAARVGDMGICVGPPDPIVKGSPTVFIGMQMAARIGDPTAHGGAITQGCATVIIGEVGHGSTVEASVGAGTGNGETSSGGKGVLYSDPLADAVAAATRESFTDSRPSAQAQALSEAASDGSGLVEPCPLATDAPAN